MQVSWSLVINILLLITVLYSIARLVRTRKKAFSRIPVAEMNENPSPIGPEDDIIAVRKVQTESTPSLSPRKTLTPEVVEQEPARKIPLSRQYDPPTIRKIENPVTLMMFLLARENRQFAGYELLQTILAAGLRFGEGQLFHRHQFTNGQGPILCSLAAATQSGIFDLQEIGGFSVRGLCLYMEASGNTKIDEERFTIMLDTARQLSEGLDALLLDDMKRPLTEQRIGRYYELLNLPALT